MLHIHYHESFRTSIYLYIKGQLDLRCVQVKSEPHLSSGQMKFNFFSYPVTDRKQYIV